eukprot:scaffold1405_cov305-Prasinococcus_capsulatus_cf.AAC.1
MYNPTPATTRTVVATPTIDNEKHKTAASRRSVKGSSERHTFCARLAAGEAQRGDEQGLEAQAVAQRHAAKARVDAAVVIGVGVGVLAAALRAPQHHDGYVRVQHWPQVAQRVAHVHAHAPTLRRKPAVLLNARARVAAAAAARSLARSLRTLSLSRPWQMPPSMRPVVTPSASAGSRLQCTVRLSSLLRSTTASAAARDRHAEPHTQRQIAPAASPLRARPLPRRWRTLRGGRVGGARHAVQAGGHEDVRDAEREHVHPRAARAQRRQRAQRRAAQQLAPRARLGDALQLDACRATCKRHRHETTATGADSLHALRRSRGRTLQGVALIEPALRLRLEGAQVGEQREQLALLRGVPARKLRRLRVLLLFRGRERHRAQLLHRLRRLSQVPIDGELPASRARRRVVGRGGGVDGQLRDAGGGVARGERLVEVRTCSHVSRASPVLVAESAARNVGRARAAQHAATDERSAAARRAGGSDLLEEGLLQRHGAVVERVQLQRGGVVHVRGEQVQQRVLRVRRRLELRAAVHVQPLRLRRRTTKAAAAAAAATARGKA